MAYKNILVPVDGSKDSKYACKAAAELADAIPGLETMHLLYCAEPIPALVGGAQREELVKEREEAAKRIFAESAPIFEAIGNPVKTHLAYGSPGETIALAAAEHQCNLIIMGTRGLGELRSLVVGSTSHDVLKYAKVPVMLAKNPE